MPVSPFDVPVPGQSLTKAPGNSKYERPPQFTNLKDANEFVFDRLNNPKNVETMLALLDSGVPVEHLARTVLFSGFAEGKWTPDLMVAMAKPVMTMVAGMAKAAGRGNAKLQSKDRRAARDTELAKIISTNKTKQTRDTSEDIPESLVKAPPTIVDTREKY